MALALTYAGTLVPDRLMRDDYRFSLFSPIPVTKSAIQANKGDEAQCGTALVAPTQSMSCAASYTEPAITRWAHDEHAVGVELSSIDVYITDYLLGAADERTPCGALRNMMS